ncbi:hypothetical protein BDV96DRAFT_573039 [Lophiotrema nucula]|uniref:Uncharacterized protein n=1 Tax=Lophiotrema nucula TaxID=690887 RepID=A0A6A5ZDR0_9PLEO|nr:hypothetical protein BDV96DRAFT_573039 [Lophiotrema nucula]
MHYLPLLDISLTRSPVAPRAQSAYDEAYQLRQFGTSAPRQQCPDWTTNLATFLTTPSFPWPSIQRELQSFVKFADTGRMDFTGDLAFGMPSNQHGDISVAYRSQGSIRSARKGRNPSVACIIYADAGHPLHRMIFQPRHQHHTYQFACRERFEV